ncbi:hypothetical protein L2E82_47164 [Cichorium intybus]|uniref:Uncharacterized protein n=1 Tax=Cichorium intybus TaxID=13427 RepID=A0ACB8YU03_CICIN|nr:hypothetical protein L2E82_47164 [Cichorium intybus]
MGDAAFDKEETEDMEEIEDEEHEEDAYVVTRDEDLEIFDNLSLKHNEQTPGDCSCFGCFLHFVDEDDGLLLLFMVCVCLVGNVSSPL